MGLIKVVTYSVRYPLTRKIWYRMVLWFVHTLKLLLAHAVMQRLSKNSEKSGLREKCFKYEKTVEYEGTTLTAELYYVRT